MININKKHLKCWLWKVLWLIGLVSLVFAWLAFKGQGLFLGIDIGLWFWNALICGVLSAPVKLDCQNCDVCFSGDKA